MENMLVEPEYLLIGSRALDYWLNVGLVKPNTDWDIISKEPVEGAEHHRWLFLDNCKLARYTSPDHTVMFNGRVVYVVSLLGLAIIKRSHLWRDLGFGKHITMYSKHLARYMDRVTEEDTELLKERNALTLKMFPQQGPNLNQTVEQFFDDAVTKVYSHDALHSLFAYQEQPMYTRLQRDSSKAWCCEDLWNDLTFVEKLQCVAEETYVIATERFLVPKDWKYPMKLAYNKALDKVCTTLCKGWFRDFAIDNYPEVLRMMDENKFLVVKEKLKTKSKDSDFLDKLS